MTQIDPDAGLAGTLARVTEVFPGIPATARTEGPGWTRLIDHHSEHVVARLLAEQEAHDRGGPALAAQQLVGRLIGVPVLQLAIAVAAERRLPVTTPADVWVRWIDHGSGPRLGAVAFTSGRLFALPDDPGADSPDVTVLADPAELGAELVESARRLAEGVIEPASRLSRRGRRALWATLSDRIANGYLLVAKQTGKVTDARLATDATLGAAPKPLHTTIDWLELDHGGATHLFKRKSVCCLIYKAPEHLDVYCSTCPLLDRAENERRLRAGLTDS